MIKRLLFLGLSCWLLVAGCTKHDTTSADSDLAATTLPSVAVGDYVGTFILAEGDVSKVSAAGVRCTVAEAGDHYTISFKGGTPELSPATPSIDKVLFAKTSGSQIGVFHSLARDGSVAGIHISTYMTNLNVEVVSGSSKIVFTGMKSQTTPP